MSMVGGRRSLVIPGEIIVEGNFRAGLNTYLENGKIYSTVMGLAEIRGRVVSVIPIKSYYIPKVGDIVIGIVTDNSPTYWQVDINSPYMALLQVSDALPRPIDPAKENIRKYFDVGDALLAEIALFDKLRSPLLKANGRGQGKLKGGILVEVSPAKVPRLIGKRGSMINMLKKELGCQIIVGQNGRVWINSVNEKLIDLAVKAVKIVDEEAQTRGLTERVKKFILKGKEKIDLESA